MPDTDDPEEFDRSHKPKRSGWRRLLRRGLITIGIIGLGVMVARWQIARIGERHLKVIVNRLDHEEPGWRLDDLEAQRQQATPPPELNSATIVLALRAEVPQAWQDYRQTRTWEWGLVTNHQLSFWEFIWLVGASNTTAPARESIRTRLLRPDVVAQAAGHYPITHHEVPYLTLLPHVDKARGVLDLLDYDARLAVIEKDPNRGIRSARAALVVARSIGDEPYLISQLVRIASDRIATQATFQVLARSQPKEGLAELQAAFRTEADFPWLQVGLRGERAMLHKLFEGLESGKITASDMNGLGVQTAGVLQIAGFRAYRAMLPGDHAKSLEILTEYLEASKLPPHEQREALAKITLPPRPPDDFRYVGTNLLVPACGKIAAAGLRCRADLLTASVAIACERFRLANNRWPDSLDEIPKETLPDVPNDPFNGKPLQYVKLPDGIAVFSVGDGDEKSARGRREQNDPLADLGQGWKLWNPELRGVPPPPPKPDPNDVPEPW